jgi:hypothetical protein
MLNLVAFWVGGMAAGIVAAVGVLLFLRDLTLSVETALVSAASSRSVAYLQFAIGASGVPRRGPILGVRPGSLLPPLGGAMFWLATLTNLVTRYIGECEARLEVLAAGRGPTRQVIAVSNAAMSSSQGISTRHPYGEYRSIHPGPSSVSCVRHESRGRPRVVRLSGARMRYQHVACAPPDHWQSDQDAVYRCHDVTS